jgi:hypothetical protein
MFWNQPELVAFQPYHRSADASMARWSQPSNKHASHHPQRFFCFPEDTSIFDI